MSQRIIHAEEEFEAFWSAYPKRAGNPKLAAKKQWLALIKIGALPELHVVLSAVKAYRSHCTNAKLAPEFIAHARTWLSQQRWADWLPQGSDAAPVATAEGWESSHPMWASFKTKLDAMNPAHWAYWFAGASPQGEALVVLSRFERDKVEEQFSEMLLRHFGHPVTVICRADAELAQKKKGGGSLEQTHHP